MRQYCRKLARAKTIDFDTEFVSERAYRPALCLIQVAADGELAVIDPRDRRRHEAVFGRPLHRDAVVRRASAA